MVAELVYSRPVISQDFLNQYTSGILNFFRSPHTGLFSVKIRKKFVAINKKKLSMKRSPDNQINAPFIDISRIKWLVFFYCGRLSSAQLDRWQAAKQRSIIDQCPVEQTAFWKEIKDLVTMDINPSLQILSWYVKGTGLG